RALRFVPFHAATLHAHRHEGPATEDPLVKELHATGREPVEAERGQVALVGAEPLRVKAFGLEREGTPKLARPPEDLDPAVGPTPRLRRPKDRDGCRAGRADVARVRRIGRREPDDLVPGS